MADLCDNDSGQCWTEGDPNFPTRFDDVFNGVDANGCEVWEIIYGYQPGESGMVYFSGGTYTKCPPPPILPPVTMLPPVTVGPSDPATEPPAQDTTPPPDNSNADSVNTDNAPPAQDDWEHVQYTDPWAPLNDWSGAPGDYQEGAEVEVWRWLYRQNADFWRNTTTGEVRDNIGGYEYQTETQTITGTRPTPPQAPPTPPPGAPADTATVLPPVSTSANVRRIQETGDWQPVGDWTPDVSEVDEGQSFTQSQSVTWHVTDQVVDADTGEILSDNSSDQFSRRYQTAVGTRPLPPPAATVPPAVVLPPMVVQSTWRRVYNESPWGPNGDWAPDASSIPQGQSFTQSRPTTRTVTDYWEDPDTGTRRDDNSHNEYSSESRDAVGELVILAPFVVVANWQHRYAASDWTPTGNWSPDPATVPSGQTFTQTRPTTRDIIDYWEDPDTGERRDDFSHPEFSSESRQADGELVVLPPFVVNEPPVQPPPPITIPPPDLTINLPPPPIVIPIDSPPPEDVTPDNPPPDKPPPQNPPPVNPPANNPPAPQQPPKPPATTGTPGHVPVTVPVPAAAQGNLLWLLLLIAALAAAADKKKK